MAALDQMLAERGAVLTKSGKVGHLILGVSEAWLDAGDQDARQRALLTAAARWAEAELGGVFAARIDRDEEGRCIVDVFVAPVHEDGRRKDGKRVVSLNKSLNVSRKRHGRMHSFAALQDSWHDYCRDNLPDGAMIERGVPKVQSGNEHVHIDHLKRKAAELDAKAAVLDKREAKVEARERTVAAATKQLQEGLLEVLRLGKSRSDSGEPGWDVPYSKPDVASLSRLVGRV